jgi:peptidoglycan-associated lipoprotein
MNSPSKSFCLALLASSTFFAGCNHTPVRPTPSDTERSGTNTQDGPGPRRGGSGGPIINIPNNPGPQPRPELGGGGPEDRVALQAQTVYFGFDSSAIKTGTEGPKLQAVAKYLNEHPDVRLLLEGHCDWRGTAEYNLGLGDRRAIAAKQYLEKIGVPAARLETLSKGSIGAPEKATEAQMEKDRRVEFVLIRAGATPAPLTL